MTNAGEDMWSRELAAKFPELIAPCAPVAVAPSWRPIINAACSVLATRASVSIAAIAGRNGPLHLHSVDSGERSELTLGVGGGAVVLATLTWEVCGRDGRLCRREGIYCDVHAPDGAQGVPRHEQLLLPPLEWMAGREDADKILAVSPRARRAGLMVESPDVGVDVDPHGEPEPTSEGSSVTCKAPEVNSPVFPCR